MFHPMAFTVVVALLGALILSVTFVPAAVALFVTGRVQEKEGRIMDWARRAYRPALDLVLRNPAPTLAAALVAVGLACSSPRAWARSSCRASTKATSRSTPSRIPGTSLTQAIEMQQALEKRIKAFPEVDKVFAKIGTAEIATDPMPPNVADNFVMLKPQSEWPDPKRTKDDLVAAMQSAVDAAPRQQLRVHAADPDALQRADLGRAQRRRGQGVRRRPRRAARERRSRSPRSSRRSPARRT